MIFVRIVSAFVGILRVPSAVLLHPDVNKTIISNAKNVLTNIKKQRHKS